MSEKILDESETLLHRLKAWADFSPHDPAQTFKKDDKWKSYTSKQAMDHVFYLALYLESQGFKEGDILATLSMNRPESLYTELSPHLLGGLSVGLYPNSTGKDLDYILKHTEAKILAVQNKEYFSKIGDSSSLHIILVFEGDAGFSPKAISMEDALKRGKEISATKKIENYISMMDPQKAAFIIFTSGTTGFPKGALLSHRNLIFASDQAIETWKIPVRNNGRMFSFLPMCHIAEKLNSVAVGITGRFQVFYASKFENVAKEMPYVRPTVLLSVPRLWEKTMEGILKKISQENGIKSFVLKFLLNQNQKAVQAKWKNDGTYGLSQALLSLVADKVLVQKIKKKLGFSELVRCGSGAAALPAHVARFFRGIGMEILEDYGQTESTGVLCMTPPGKDCSGTVGIPLPGSEFKIADDGEILTKGPHVFLGYFKNEAATKEVLDKDGWLRSGDLGKWTDEGTVQIIGRKKDVMKSSGGKMIAPAPIEEKIKIHDYVSHACIVGDGKKYFCALVTLSEPILNKVTQEKPKHISGNEIQAPEILNEMKTLFENINKSLASYEQIKYFKVLARDFSIDAGEMTPTLKVKRFAVEKNFKDLIESMYH